MDTSHDRSERISDWELLVVQRTAFRVEKRLFWNLMKFIPQANRPLREAFREAESSGGCLLELRFFVSGDHWAPFYAAHVMLCDD